MKDIEILSQLLKGNHLNNQELDKAKMLVESLKAEIKRRTREKFKNRVLQLEKEERI